jgi:HEAT repeat protein
MKSLGGNKQHQSSTRKLSQLMKQLEDREASVRVSALESLANIDHPSVFDAVVKALSDRNSTVRVTAAEGLGQLKDKEGVPYLLDKLTDSNYEVRMRAAESLGILLKCRNSPRPLVKLLQDTDELVRITAAEVLGAIGDQKALPQLRIAIQDSSPLVRSYVAEAIGKLGDQRETVKLEKELKKETSETAKVGLYQALYTLGRPQFLQDLLSLLQSRNYKVRCATANTLSAIHINKPEVPAILNALRKALRQEPTVAARSSIRSSLRAIKQ